MQTNTIVPNSFYEHEDYGLIKVVDVTPTTVAFEIRGEQTRVPGMGGIPRGKYEAPSMFKKKVKPANVTVSVEPALMNSGAATPGE